MVSDSRKLAKNIAISVFAIIIFLLVFEAVLAFTSKSESKLNIVQDPLCIYVESDLSDYVMVPNFETMHVTREFSIHIKTNHIGLRETRDFSSSKPQNTARIFFLGDSFIFGYGAEQGKTIPAMLGKEMKNSGKEVEVINLGVTGYDFLKEKAFFERLSYLGPDVVLVGTNYTDLKTFPSANCFDVDLYRCFKQKQECTDQQSQFPLQDVLGGSRVYSFFRERIEGFQKQAEAEKEWETTQTVLGQFMDKIKERNAKPVLVIIPGREIVTNTDFVERNYYSKIRDFAKAKGISLIDVSDTILSNKDKALYYPADGHLTEEGIQLVSKDIAAELEKILEEKN